MTWLLHSVSEIPSWLIYFINEILLGIVYIIVAPIALIITCWPIILLAAVYFIWCDATGTWVESSKRGAYPKMSWENK